MTPHSIIQHIRNSEFDGIKIGFTDLDGVLRGKIIHKDKFFKAIEEGMGFCDVVFGWDINDKVYEKDGITGWHTAYPDALLSLDIKSYRTFPWENDQVFLLGDFAKASSPVAQVCPRTLLKNIQAKGESMGFNPLFGAEYEWFNFKEDPHSLEQKEYLHLTNVSPGMFGYSLLRADQGHPFFQQLFMDLAKADIPLEGLHTETGPGVLEAAIQAADILTAADRAVLFKHGVKAIAHRHQLIASFMAKWNAALPGCSGHIHQSLWDDEGKKNLFYDEQAPHQMSTLMQHYLAGQLMLLPLLLPMMAPTINSYKRLLGGDWAPSNASWGIENRTAAFRIINHSSKNIRIEARVPGSDANPYLAMAALLASGLYGIAHQIPLDQEAVKGNAYALTDKPLPSNLYEAIRAFQNSPITVELFGDIFVNHFVQSRLEEWDQFQQSVSQWELKRYFEII